MSRDNALPSPGQITCQCGSMVNLVPFTTDPTVMIPVDVDRDPDGDLVVVGCKAGYTIRPIRNGEEVGDRNRRRAHWGTCPHRHLWRDVMRTAGVGGVSVHDPMRAGPCARCGQRHPWRYGGPVASPVCDQCREELGKPLMGEYH